MAGESDKKPRPMWQGIGGGESVVVGVDPGEAIIPINGPMRDRQAEFFEKISKILPSTLVDAMRQNIPATKSRRRPCASKSMRCATTYMLAKKRFTTGVRFCLPCIEDRRMVKRLEECEDNRHEWNNEQTKCLWCPQEMTRKAMSMGLGAKFSNDLSSIIERMGPP